MNTEKPNVPKMIAVAFAVIFGAFLLFLCLWNLFFLLIGMTS